MKRILTTLLVLFFLIVVLVGAGTAYFLAVFGVIDVPWLSGVEASERKGPVLVERSAPREFIVTVLNRDIADDGEFDFVLTERDANGLLRGELGPGAPVSNLTVEFLPGELVVEGELNGRFPVPFGATVTFTLGDDGRAQIGVSNIKVAVFGLPGFASSAANDFTSQIFDLNRILSEQGVVKLSSLEVGTDGMRLSGTSSEPIQLPDVGAPGVPEGPLPEIPEPRAKAPAPPGTIPPPGAWVYLAIGDSLTAGVGASGPAESFPSRFHQYLEATYGVSLVLENFGVSGASSSDLMGTPSSQIELAIRTVGDLKADGDPETRVHVVTFTMGANDVFPVLQGPVCFSDPTGAVCQAQLDQAIEEFEANVGEALGRLRDELESDTVLLVGSYYNPFNFGTGLIFETVSQETVDKLNAAVRRIAEASGAAVAEVGLLFGDLAFGITHISAGDIHANDLGYGVITRAFEDVYETAGPFPR